MSAGFDGVRLNQVQQGQTHDASQHAGQLNQQTSGSYQGQQVQQMSISSLVEQSQEEAGQMLQEKSSKSLARRDAKGRAASRVQEIMQKYLKGVGDVQQTERFEKLAESLKKLAKGTPDEIRGLLEELKQESDDENIESALLLALEELFATEGGHDDLLASIREVKATFGEELKEFYQQQVQNYEDVGEVYQQLLGEYGEGDFLSATESLITRLGTDLQAQGSSVDDRQVRATVDSLYHLEVARNTFMSFSDLVGKMQKLFDVNLTAN